MTTSKCSREPQLTFNQSVHAIEGRKKQFYRSTEFSSLPTLLPAGGPLVRCQHPNYKQIVGGQFFSLHRRAPPLGSLLETPRGARVGVEYSGCS